MISPEQSRAARGWLGWNQQGLADRAKISLSTVRDFETGKRAPIRNNLDAMQEALEAGGVRLVFTDEGEPAGILARDARLDAAPG
jgi:ribosome-binding protein aMBF1 (putative translation factor)